MAMNYIGIDLGTSAVKLLLVSGEGEILNTVTKEYPLSFPHPGWSEQNPEDWVKGMKEGLKELLEGFDPSKVSGIGCGGQMHGLVVLDEKDEVIRPAILWNDGRTQEETDRLNNEIGKERLSELTGNIAFAGFTAPKILWLKKHEPENFEKVRRVMLPKDYLNYVMTGVFATDVSDASGMLLLDVEHRCWSEEMLKICSLTKEQLPALYESYEKIGTVTKEFAEEFGFNENVTVCAGAGDNAAAAVGTGTVGEGTCNISLGTSGTVFIPSSRFVVDSGNSLHAFCHGDGQYHLMGCILSAASCNLWWMKDILHTDDFSGEQDKINPEKLGRNHVFYLPYLMGERAPHNDANARSCFIGMTMDSSREDLTQAVLEGVAFALRDSLEAARAMGIDVQESMICGGGSRSALWKRMIANVLNIRLNVPETEQGPGYGGAILAMVAEGAYADVNEAVQHLIRIKETVEPEEELTQLYEERYKVYRKLYPALKDVFPEL